MPDNQSTWMPKAKTERTVVWLLVIISVVSVVLVIAFKPGLVTFWPFTLAEFVQLVTPIFLVALLIERVLEVFLTSWRAVGAREVKLMAKAGRATEENVVDYQSRTQRIAFIAGTAIGIVVSALGVRFLGLFVDPAVFETLSQTQRSAFIVADVLLTGAVLGGGADALHKLVTVFTNFMESTAERAKPSGG